MQAPLAAGAATRYIAPFLRARTVGLWRSVQYMLFGRSIAFPLPGVSFARYISSRWLAHLAVVDRFHRCPGPDHRAPAVFAPRQDPAPQAVR